MTGAAVSGAREHAASRSTQTHLEKANTALRRKVGENRRLYRNLEGIYADTVKALGAAIDAKDPYTRGHSDRVARIAVALAKALGLPESQISALRVASHLHDIGKIAVDNSVLRKPGRIDEDEMLQIHRHPAVSYVILRTSPSRTPTWR